MLSDLLSISNSIFNWYRFEHPEIAIAEDAAEALLGVEEDRRRPALDHFAVTPAGHSIGLAARGGIGIFDDVGAAQRTTQRGRKPEPVDSEHFPQAFTQAA